MAAPRPVYQRQSVGESWLLLLPEVDTDRILTLVTLVPHGDGVFLLSVLSHIFSNNCMCSCF